MNLAQAIMIRLWHDGHIKDSGSMDSDGKTKLSNDYKQHYQKRITIAIEETIHDLGIVISQRTSRTVEKTEQEKDAHTSQGPNEDANRPYISLRDFIPDRDCGCGGDYCTPREARRSVRLPNPIT